MNTNEIAEQVKTIAPGASVLIFEGFGGYVQVTLHVNAVRTNKTNWAAINDLAKTMRAFFPVETIKVTKPVRSVHDFGSTCGTETRDSFTISTRG